MTCTCKEPGTPGVKHRVDGPCFYLPNLLDGTTEFMLRAGQLDAGPQFGEFGDDLRELRADLMYEEYNEYRDGEIDNDLVETVDGLLDIIVIAWGTLLAYIGEDKAKTAAAEVVRSNLDKVIGDGLPIFREDRKVLKPAGWTPPDIAGALEIQRPAEKPADSVLGGQ